MVVLAPNPSLPFPPTSPSCPKHSLSPPSKAPSSSIQGSLLLPFFLLLPLWVAEMFITSPHSPFNLPNITCYIRIIVPFFVLTASEFTASQKIYYLVFSSLLDLIDGPIARYFNCCSYYGAVLDVIADNVLRTTSWALALVDFCRLQVKDETIIHPLYDYFNLTPTPSSSSLPSNHLFTTSACFLLAFVVVFVVSLEWLTMVSTQIHAVKDARHWKTCRENDPYFVALFFKDSFKNPLGIVGIIGIFGLPFSIFATLNFTCIRAGVLRHLVGDNYEYQVYLLAACFVVCAVGRVLSSFVEVYLISSFANHLLTTMKDPIKEVVLKPSLKEKKIN